MRAAFLLPLLAAGLFVVGCIQHSHPTLPEAPPPDEAVAAVAQVDTVRVPILSTWVEVDPATLAVTLTPQRTATAGDQDVLEVVDATQFLSDAPCEDCLRLVGVGITAKQTVFLDFAVRHPFSSPAQTANLNQNFSVFNVEGVVLFEETGAELWQFPTLGQNVVIRPRLLNPDGYTGYLDGALAGQLSTIATIHPYRLFFRDYTAGTYDPLNPQGFPNYADVQGYLAMGQGKGPDIQRFEFEPRDTGTPVRFLLVIEASFGRGAIGDAEKQAPTYRCPQYNKKAASEVHAGAFEWSGQGGSGLGFSAGTNGNPETLHVRVLDINDSSTGVSVGTGLNELRAASDVTTLRFEAPGIVTGTLAYNAATEYLGGTGNDPSNPITYALAIAPNPGLSAGPAWGLLEVEDSYPVAQNAWFPADGAGYLDPGHTTPVPLTHLSTYQLIPLDVQPASVAPLRNPYSAETSARFGYSVAAVDLDGDSLPEVAVGEPWASNGLFLHVGRVTVFKYEKFFGPGLQWMTEITPPVPVAETYFGATVARFPGIDSIGADLLLVGSPMYGLGAGKVTSYVYATGTLIYSQEFAPVAPLNSLIGERIVTADFSGNGVPDAIIGAPGYPGGNPSEGRFYIWEDLLITQGPFASPTPIANGFFGRGLASWPTPGADGAPPWLAVAEPGLDPDAGRVHLYAVQGGTPGTPQTLAPFDPTTTRDYGAAMAFMDFNHDGNADLVIGAPGHITAATGLVELRPWHASGTFLSTVWVYASGNPVGFGFGGALATGDYNGDGVFDLAVGSPVSTVSGLTLAGEAYVYPGGLLPSTVAFPLRTGGPDPEASALFGWALETWDGPGARDRILVGSPLGTFGPTPDNGFVAVF